MFRGEKVADTGNIKTDDQKVSATPAPTISVVDKTKSAEVVNTDVALKDLIEKNLKWSQIIYEQNRKINSKLMWMAIASWVKLFLILVPLILAIFFLPPLLKGVWSQYSQLLGVGVSDPSQKTNSLDSLLKIIERDPAKQEQIKALLQ